MVNPHGHKAGYPLLSQKINGHRHGLPAHHAYTAQIHITICMAAVKNTALDI